MKEKIKIGISSCLLGHKVRYDGGHKLDLYLRDTLGWYVEWVPVCPEVECGLPVPREAMRLVRSAESLRLVTSVTGADHTDRMLKWAGHRLSELEKEGLCGFIFKSRSPSSGMRGVKVYGRSGVPVGSGVGIFADALIKSTPFLPVADEVGLQDHSLRENFIERIFVFRRWRQFSVGGSSVDGLIQFHSRHKLLVLSHSPRHYSRLGNLVAQAGGYRFADLCDDYLELLMEGMKAAATIRKHTNVLQHIMGYFKRRLTPAEKKELLAVIEEYRGARVPLLVPLVLLRHYVMTYDEPYLKGQCYLYPDPDELMMRNHA